MTHEEPMLRTETICKAFAEVLLRPEVTAETDFFEAGGDSLKVLLLEQKLEPLGMTARDVYRLRTPKALATASPTKPRTEGGATESPLTAAQAGMWCEMMRMRGKRTYNCSVLLKLSEETDTERLQWAMAEAEKLHPALCAELFVNEAGEMAMRENRTQHKLYTTEVTRKENAVWLWADMSHLICDEVSKQIWLEDVERLYMGALPERELYTIYDYALEEQQERKGAFYTMCRDWYLQEFGAAEGCTMPKPDYAFDPDEEEEEVGVCYRETELETAALEQAAAKMGVSATIAATTMFGLTLGENACFATLHNGRKDYRTRRTMGMLVKTMPVWMKGKPATLQEAMRRVKQQMTDCTAHDAYSFAELCRETKLDSRTIFAYQADKRTRTEWAGNACCEMPTEEMMAGQPLFVSVSTVAGKLVIRTEYLKNLYAETSMEGLMMRFEQQLQGLINETMQQGETCVVEATFEQNVLQPLQQAMRQYAQNKALCIGQTYYTYAQLHESVEQQRAAIRAEHNDQHCVLIMTNDDLQTYATMLALWMEGKAYVPLHPDWPEERRKEVARQVAEAEQNDAGAKRAVYVLFTSGSTGKPKGVPVSGENLAAFVAAFGQRYALHENDRCLQCFDLTFDLSVVSFLAPWLHGACVYTIPHGEVKYFYTSELIEEQRLTFALMTPSTIKLLRPWLKTLDASALRYSLFCGEALPTDLTREWAECAPNAIIENVYGPTEDTIFCSAYRYERHGEVKEHNGTMCIGQSMAGCRMAIFGPNQEPCAVGEKGELCLAGKQLTTGYLNDTAKNEAAFFVHNGVRWYRTGDLCYADAQGDVMYCGRLDHQVKVQGYRVEMGEIEHQAQAYLGQVATVCVPYEEHCVTQLVLLVEAQSCDTEALLTHLRGQLPNYMVPAQVVCMEQFATNANGKTDRKEIMNQLEKKLWNEKK